MKHTIQMALPDGMREDVQEILTLRRDLDAVHHKTKTVDEEVPVYDQDFIGNAGRVGLVGYETETRDVHYTVPDEGTRNAAAARLRGIASSAKWAATKFAAQAALSDETTDLDALQQSFLSDISDKPELWAFYHVAVVRNRHFRDFFRARFGDIVLSHEILRENACLDDDELETLFTGAAVPSAAEARWKAGKALHLSDWDVWRTLTPGSFWLFVCLHFTALLTYIVPTSLLVGLVCQRVGWVSVWSGLLLLAYFLVSPVVSLCIQDEIERRVRRSGYRRHCIREQLSEDDLVAVE